MASFHVTSSEASPHLGEDDQLLALQPSQHQEGMLHKVWTIRSDKKVEMLNLNLPGVVFIDYDAKLGSSSAPVAPPTTDDPESDASQEGGPQHAGGRVVAKVVVTSDSIDVLEGLEVVPLDVDNIDEGFKFRVKNEDAELKGSVLTQVLVSDKNALREFYGSTAEFVLGDAVLVQDDPSVEVKVWIFNSASLYLSSEEGLSLRSFDATVQGTGIYQLQVPSINLQGQLSLAAMGRCTLAVAANTITAKEIIPMAIMKKGDIVVHSSNLTAKSIFSSVSYGGSINFVGDGEVKKQVAVVVLSGEINTGGIVSEKANVVIGWSGRAVVSARKELDAISRFFGTVEYTNAKPEVITDSSWFWLKRTPRKSVTPDAPDPVKSYEFRDPPLRQPVPIHHRVKKSKRDEPQLEKPNATSWVSRYSKLGLLTGVVTVGAIVVIAARRKGT